MLIKQLLKHIVRVRPSKPEETRVRFRLWKQKRHDYTDLEVTLLDFDIEANEWLINLVDTDAD